MFFVDPDLGALMRRLGEPDLLRLQSGIPGNELLEKQVAFSLGGRGEGQVKRFSRWGNHFSIGQAHLPGEGPCGPRDYGSPVPAAKLDLVWVVVDVDVGETANHPFHRLCVRWLSADRLCAPWYVRDHIWMVCGFHCCEVAGVEGVVALFQPLELLFMVVWCAKVLSSRAPFDISAPITRRMPSLLCPSPV
jgi:hypothetical protein